MTPLEEVQTLTRDFVEYIKIGTPSGFSDSDQIRSFVLRDLAKIKDVIVKNGICHVDEYLKSSDSIKDSVLEALGVATISGSDEEVDLTEAFIHDFKAFYEEWKGEVKAIGAFYEDEFGCRCKIS